MVIIYPASITIVCKSEGRELNTFALGGNSQQPISLAFVYLYVLLQLGLYLSIISAQGSKQPGN